MNNLQKRIALFLIGCVGTRLGLVYAAKNVGARMLEVLGALAVLPAVGFFYLFFTDSRKTGPEVFGDRIWWNHMRPFHGAMYTIFAAMALFHIPNAWMVLLLDVFVGFLAFLKHHTSILGLK
jgi:hypothetical protein